MKGVFFDWDGTLVDTIPGVLEAHNHVRRHYGLKPWEMEWYKKNMGQSALKTYPGIFGENSQAAIDMLYSYIEDKHLERLTAMPGAAEALAAVHDQGVVMAIVSNKRHKYLLREIEHLGWGEYFAAVVGAGASPKDKPDPEPIFKAAQESGIDPQMILYVGDNETDLMASRAAGCPCILVLHGEEKADLVSRYSPMVIEKLMDLQSVIARQINQNLLRA